MTLHNGSRLISESGEVGEVTRCNGNGNYRIILIGGSSRGSLIDVALYPVGKWFPCNKDEMLRLLLKKQNALVEERARLQQMISELKES